MKHQMSKQLHKNTSKNSAWSCVKGKSASHSAKAHDSSTGPNTIHYTKVGFPISVQSQTLGASQLGKAVLSCAISVGDGHFYFAESQLHPIPTPTHHRA